MRNLSASMEKKIASYIQAGDSALSANIWVSRPTTQLVDDVFLEKQRIPFGTNVTKTSIAACHPRLMRDATEIYVGYIDGGIAKVAKAVYNYRMESHEWVDTGFSEPAEDISLCFNGTMPKNTRGMVEFKTEEKPWVFWVSSGALYARKLGSDTAVTLAEANCKAVSVVRAMWSDIGDFDFGLIAFFILGGYLYYRQYIGGEWYDGELVSATPAGVLWTDVSAFRTWDYRVGVQLVAQDGSIYELFTQYMGVGKQNAEHLEIYDTRIQSKKLTRISYHSSSACGEHINVGNIEYVMPYQGIYAIGVPSLIDVYNIDDGSGNWGKKVVFVFDKELESKSVQDSIGSFYFVDSEETWFFPSTITMDNTGRKAILTYVDINNAVGECVAHYDPGSVVTMLEEVLEEQSFNFMPMNIVPNDSVLPEVDSIWNMNENGTKIAIRFTKPIVSVPAESSEKFIVTIAEPLYSPGGDLANSIKPVISVSKYEDDDNVIVLEFADTKDSNIRNAVGEVIVQYIGTMLTGEDGPVLGFRKKFLPEGLYMKPNPHDGEHIEIKDISKRGTLTAIEYLYAKDSGEHLEIVSATMSGVLTHVNDL